MKHALGILAIVSIFLAACTSSPTEQTSVALPAPTSPASTSSTSSTTLPAPPPTTTTTDLSEDEHNLIKLDAAAPAKHLENYLAALAAGAYEQAGWSGTNAGAVYGSDEVLSADHLRQACEPNLCNGPYETSLVRVGETDAGSTRWTFSVTHATTGEVSEISVGSFEGQLVIDELPPLVASASAPGILANLFGSSPPDYVVLERFNAYEIWDDGEPRWVTNWFADETVDVAGAYVAAGFTTNFEIYVGRLDDPQAAVAFPCAGLVMRSGIPLVYRYCDSSNLTTVDGAQVYDLLVDPDNTTLGDGEQAGLYRERGGVAVVTYSDAEGSTSTMTASTGADLIGDDYAGFVRLSADGRLIAYTNHNSSNAAYSHFWSAEVVVRDSATGAELERLVLDGPVTCIESDGVWVVMCEGDIDLIPYGDPGSVALVAYNLETAELNRVTTRTQLLLPPR